MTTPQPPGVDAALVTAVSMLTQPGSISRMAVCPVGDAISARRTMLGELVDDAGGLAAPGAKPKVRGFPDPDAGRILRGFRDIAASPECPPNLAEYLTRNLEVLIAWGASLIGDGKRPCLLIGVYEVTDEPDDTAKNRPVRVFDGEGKLLTELYRGAAPS